MLNVKLIHIYFGLISKDFFTKDKVFKYKMITTFVRDADNSYRHLLWECREARKNWNVDNEHMEIIPQML
jgi:hypothetical protein